jgi:hypothetical protein
MAGPRVYTIEEANELVSTFVEAFDRLDALRDELRVAKVKLTAIEMIWGRKVQAPDCPDHDESEHLVQQLKELEEAFNHVLSDLGEHGITVKDIDEGLVDVFHVRDGRLVNLCWRRGETEFVAWHHVDEGFAARHAL